MGRKELGISSKEYNDALILEKLFYITKKVKCSTCMFKNPTAVDYHKLELLCDTCSSRCKTVSRIGYDDINMRTIVELERKYKIDDGKSIKGHKEPVNVERTTDKHRREKHRKGDKTVKKHSENRKNGSTNAKISPISPIDSEEESFDGRNDSIYKMYDAPNKIPGMAGLMAAKYQQNPFKNLEPHLPHQINRSVTYNNYPNTYNYHDMPAIQVPNTDRPNINHPQDHGYNIQQDQMRLALPSGVGRMSKNPFAQYVYNSASRQRYA